MRIYLYEEMNSKRHPEEGVKELFWNRKAAEEYFEQQVNEAVAHRGCRSFADLLVDDPENDYDPGQRAIIVEEDGSKTYRFITVIKAPNGVLVPLGDGTNIAVEISDDPLYKEVYVGIADDEGAWLKNIATVEGPNYEHDSYRIIHYKNADIEEDVE